MGRFDLDAVAARRASIPRELANYERQRSELLVEDQELEVAERVLKRLSDDYYEPQIVIPRAQPLAIQPPEPAFDAVRGLLSRGLDAGREGWGALRLMVERRIDEATRRPR